MWKETKNRVKKTAEKKKNSFLLRPREKRKKKTSPDRTLGVDHGKK